MYHLLSLSIGGQQIQAPPEIPQGGLEAGGAGAKFIQGSISLLLFLAIILSFIFLIWGGLMWIISQGDKGKIDSARKTIIFSFVGLFLALLSFMIIKIIGQTLFGVNPLQP